MSQTSTPKRSSAERDERPSGVRVHGRWYQKRPHRGAPWQNISEVAEGLLALRKELARRETEAAITASAASLPVTVTQLVALALHNRAQKGLGARTLKGYEALADGPIAAAFGEMPWREVTRGMIVGFLDAALTAGKTTTGNRARAVLSIAFNYAIAREWTEFNPVSKTEPNPPTSELTGPKHAARAASFATRYVPRDEFMVVFEKLNEWHQDVLACAYLIGVRQSDLLLLTRDAIRGDAIYIKERKTARGTRKSIKVLMGTDVRFHVERALARQTAIANRPLEVLRPRSGKVARRLRHWPESERVFCNADNKPVSQSALRAAITRAGGTFDFRDIRATVVTDDEADKAEASVVTASNILGHTAEMLAVYQKHEVKRSDPTSRGALPEVLGVRPKLRVIQGRSM